MSHKKLAHPLVFFVSTGRCGTQWLASNLARFYEDKAVVTHEPLGPYYLPSTFFRRFDVTLDDVFKTIPQMQEHLQKIEDVVSSGKMYIEVGWPVYGILPALIRHYGEENIKLIHLYRHPFSCSLSFYNGAWYDLDAIERKSKSIAEVFIKYKEVHELDPVNHATYYAKDYLSRWNSMSLFEKCVFLWLEVNHFGFELEAMFPKVQIFRVKFEDLIEKPKEDTMRALSQFLNLPYKQEMITATDTRVDTWTWTFSVNKDQQQAAHQPAQQEKKKATTQDEITQFKKELLQHPLAIQLAAKLGYKVENASDDMGTTREKKGTEPLYISKNASKIYKADVVNAYAMSSTVATLVPYFKLSLLIESVITLGIISDTLAQNNFDVGGIISSNRPTAIRLGLQLFYLLGVHFANKGIQDLSKARSYAWALLVYFGVGGWLLSQYAPSVLSLVGGASVGRLGLLSAGFGVIVGMHYSIGLWVLYRVMRFRFSGKSMTVDDKKGK